MSLKPVILVILLAIIFYVWQQSSEKPAEPPVQSINTESEVPEYKNQLTIDYGGKVWGLVWVVVTDLNTITLSPNFVDKKDTTTLVKENGCKDLINGGFYSKDNEPIGLFISDGNLQQEKISDDFFSGIASISTDGNFYIGTDSLPNARLAVQSGPILWENGEARELRIKGDKNARRMVVARGERGEVIFLTLFDNSLSGNGPLLAEVPQLLKLAEEKIGTKFTDALNLDGGSASAFYADSFSLTEYTYIGSYFCVH